MESEPNIVQPMPADISGLDFEAGEVLLIDKPLTWTSFDVVKKIRNGIRIKKVGHAGTLDPLATGLLIVCTGKKTKVIDAIVADEKEYTGTIKLGATTPSFDLETEESKSVSLDGLTNAAIIDVAKSFEGHFMQVPPVFSAIQIDGKRMYVHARAGTEIIPEARAVTISEIEITSIELPLVHFRVVCSKGTYIRSLANDIGARLNVGGYLTSLCRTRIGNYYLKDAFQLQDLIDAIKAKKESEIENSELSEPIA